MSQDTWVFGIGREFRGGVCAYHHRSVQPNMSFTMHTVSIEFGIDHTIRATIEEEYSRRLYRLIRGTLGSHEIGTLRESLNTLQKETEAIAKQHSNIALQIRSELEEPLHTLSSDMRATRKAIQSNLEKLRRIKTAQEQQVQKFKEKIEDKNGRTSGYGSQSGLFLGKTLDRNSSKIDKAQIAAQNNNDYMLAITVLQETSIKWIREWKIACDKFQDLEEKRISFIKDGLWAFCAIISTACVSNSKSYEKLRASIEKCNPQNDIQLFIRTKGTGKEIPNPPKSKDPRNGIEDLNESDYSIAQFFRVSDPQFRSDAMMHHFILNENKWLFTCDAFEYFCFESICYDSVETIDEVFFNVDLDIGCVCGSISGD
ncbi:hypothetical protein PCK1_001182, partial [Pneumocystis canis]